MATTGGPGYATFMRVDVDVGIGAKRILFDNRLWPHILDGQELVVDGKINPAAVKRIEALLDTADNLPKGCQLFRIGPSASRPCSELLVLHPEFPRTEPFAVIPEFIPTFRDMPPP